MSRSRLGALLLGSLLVFVIYQWHFDETTNWPVFAPSSQPQRILSENSVTERPQGRNKIELPVNDRYPLNPEFVPRADAIPLWHIVEASDEIDIHRANPIKARLIDLDEGVLEQLEAGLSIQMHIPQSQRVLSATIKNKKNNNYSVTLTAEVDGAEGLFYVQLTFSEDAVFVNIETPEGTFIVEKQKGQYGDQALIYDQAEIYDQLDYQQSDAISLKNN